MNANAMREKSVFANSMTLGRTSFLCVRHFDRPCSWREVFHVHRISVGVSGPCHALFSKAPQGNSDADCMERVCRVLQYLAAPLSCEVLVECAHRDLVGESLDLIREDLNTLPKRLERLQKDYHETSAKCIRWLARLTEAKSSYAIALKEKRCSVYLVSDPVVTFDATESFLPCKPLEGFENVHYPPGRLPVVGYTCDEYLLWQKQMPNLANYLKYYPAEVAVVAESLAAELSGLRGALVELRPSSLTLPDVEPQDGKAHLSEPPKKKEKKPGRKPLSRTETRKRQRIVEAWTGSRGAGISKSDFCDSRDIDIAYLDTCLDWHRKQGNLTT